MYFSDTNLCDGLRGALSLLHLGEERDVESLALLVLDEGGALDGVRLTTETRACNRTTEFILLE